MKSIVLTDPVPSHSDLERLQLFAGRHLGEQEFDRMQAYMDRRMAPLLAALETGIVSGLEVRVSPVGVDDGFTLGPGLALAGNGRALGLYYPLRMTWDSLIQGYLQETAAASAAGVFYLTLRRSEAYIDADPEVDPCQRAEFDPTRDAQRVLVGTVGLTRLAFDPAVVSANSREQVENWVAANNVDGRILATMIDAVPLGVVAVEQTGTDAEGLPIYRVAWFSEAAGRFTAVADSGYHVLLQQVNHAFRRILLAADERPDSMSIQEYLRDNLSLDFLPAAGELPRELITGIASTSPSIHWLPQHLAVDMVAVPVEAVAEMVERHLPRRVVDLRQPAGDRLRLLLAVNDRDYKPELLDLPQTDARLEQDSYRYFQRAYRLWLEWMRQFHRLYFVVDDEVLEPADLEGLDLPQPVDPPQLPQDFYTQVIDESLTELGAESGSTPFYPYRNGRPAFPPFYRDWGVVSGSGSSENVLPPPLVEPQTDGYVIQYAIAQNELEAIDNQVRAVRTRLEKTRDYLLLQRQQLDNQTVSLAALAGGVAGDGSGLQVARWLPFTQLKARQPEAEPDGESAPTEGDGTVVDGGATDGGSTTTGAGTAASMYFATVPSSYINYASNVTANNYASNYSSAALALSSAEKTNNLVAGLSSNFISHAQPSKTLGSNLVYASTLRKTPTVYSALQFNLNNSRLDKIAEAPKQALTRPAFEAKEFRFGVLEHIRPEIQEYKKALRGMRELITTLTDLFDTADANSLRNTLDGIGVPKSIESLELDTTATSEEELELASARVYEALFEASQILTKQIAFVEGRYNRIEAQLEGRLRARINKEARVEKLAALIAKATQELENIDKRRVEYLGDYGVAQRLVDADWLDVYHRNQERTRILTTALEGVYFVRERQTSISMPLADPLELRYGASTDIVPGCDWETDPELPDELEDFFDAVLEIPMCDWAPLKELQPLIPPPVRIDYIRQLRLTRLQSKTSKQRNISFLGAGSPRPVKASLYSVRLQSQSLLAQLAAYQFPQAVVSARQRRREVAKVMSLEDLLSGARGQLQQQARQLSLRLEQAVNCLLEKLNDLPPSLRLQWAQLAEDDRLRVDEVARWPGLERAEKDDFNTTRTIAELVAWYWRQLDSDASAAGRGAMRNLLRATVIQSALGDPAEILQGEVQVPPRRLARGEPLRLKLNRVARPGTVLQLMSPRQEVVALLNVDDDDDKGTVAQITRVTKSSARIDTRYRVVASKLTQAYRF